MWTRGRNLIALGGLLLCAWVCWANSAAPPPSPQMEEWKATYRRPLQTAPEPDDNRWTAERAELGKMLFFDPRLSGNGQFSCASCHNPGFSWSDGLPRAVGMRAKVLPRKTPTLLDIGWSTTLFWDGRASSLEEQALEPILNPDEMNQKFEVLLARLSGPYRSHFQRAYPGERLTEHTVARALACYERTIVSAKAPFDAWVEGDEGAISAQARHGFELFNGKAKCATCHSGWRFTDDAFHDIGATGHDKGRGKLMPDFDTMEYAFKTPTLRDVARRNPYLHNGSESTLADVIELYDQGGRVRRRSLSDEIQPLHLSAREKRDLLAFLNTLSSEPEPFVLPSLPRVSERSQESKTHSSGGGR